MRWSCPCWSIWKRHTTRKDSLQPLTDLSLPTAPGAPIDIVVDVRYDDDRLYSCCDSHRSDPKVTNSKRLVLQGAPRPKTREELIARLLDALCADMDGNEMKAQVDVVLLRDMYRVVVENVRDVEEWRTGRIGLDMSLVKYYNEFDQRRYRAMFGPKGVNEEIPLSSASHVREWALSPDGDAIVMKDMRFKVFQGKLSSDPCMESLRIHDVSCFTDCLPNSVIEKGGAFVTTSRNNILSLGVNTTEYWYDRFAVKVSVEKVNVPSGKKERGLVNVLDGDNARPDFATSAWLDLTYRRTWVDELYPKADAETPCDDLTQPVIADIRIDLYPKFHTSVEFFRECSASSDKLDMFSTPRELGIEAGSVLGMVPNMPYPSLPPSGGVLEVAANVVVSRGSSVGCIEQCGKSRLSTSSSDTVSDEEIYLNVLMLQGRRVPVRTGRSDTVRTLKRKIHEASGIPVESQRIVYKKNRLEDDRTLQEYGIRHCESVYVLLRLRGPVDPSATTSFLSESSHNAKCEETLDNKTSTPRTVLKAAPVPHLSAAYDMSAGVHLHLHVLDAEWFEDAQRIGEGERVVGA